jgi:hypothetical protein
MRAIIFGAGRGSRLAGAGGAGPKCLLRMGDRTLLEWQAETNSLSSLWLARPLLLDGFVVLNGDVLAHPQLIEDLVTDWHDDSSMWGRDAFARRASRGARMSPAFGEETETSDPCMSASTDCVSGRSR